MLAPQVRAAAVSCFAIAAVLDSFLYLGSSALKPPSLAESPETQDECKLHREKRSGVPEVLVTLDMFDAHGEDPLGLNTADAPWWRQPMELDGRREDKCTRHHS